MMRRHGERLVGFSIALLFALAAPAGAQLQVVAQPTSAVAGANFLDEGLWGLPTVVTFDDGDLFGVCRPVTDYKVDVYWGDPPVAVPRPTTRLPAQAIYKRVNVAPGRCEYGARGNATYMKAGNFSYSVTVCRAGVPCAAATAAAGNGARIAQAQFTGTVLSNLSPDLSPTATQSFYCTISLISDDNRYTCAVDFQSHV